MWWWAKGSEGANWMEKIESSKDDHSSGGLTLEQK